ncbi:MAG: acyl-CoA dehydrogenase family protein [Gemmatimonadota bacterium]
MTERDSGLGAPPAAAVPAAAPEPRKRRDGRAPERGASGLCRSFFSAEVREDLLLPYPRLSDEEAESFAILRESIESFARERIDSRRIDEEGRIPPEVLSGLAKLGVFGLQVPEEHAGFGASTTFYARVFETLAQFDMSVVTTFGAHSSIGTKGLLLFGTPEQRSRFLPELARGERLAAFALTEPGAGSDDAGIRTRAVYDGERDEYVLDGTKIWITNGGIAGLFTVFARTEVAEFGERRDRISAFLVPRETAGVSTGAEEHKLGIKGSSTTEVHFEGARVPASNLLGPKGKGFKVAMEVLNSGRLGLAAGCVGGGRAILAEALRHATERRQFGKPLVDFELIREKLARMDLGIFGMESMVYLTTGLVDRGVRDTSIESAVCKVHCSETIWGIVNEALQVAGGMGYMKEYPYERMLRDSRINLIFEGTNEILRLYTALTGLQEPGELLREVGHALKHPVSELGVLREYAARRVRRTLARPEVRGLHPGLAPERQRLEEYVAALAGAAEAALRRHKKEIPERQIVLRRVADSIVDLYLMAAVLSRADAALRRMSEATEVTEGAAEAAAEPEVLRCRIIVNEAWRRVRRNLATLERNSDADVLAVAEQVQAAGGYGIR